MTREIPLMKEFLISYKHERVRLFRRNIINKPVQDIHTGRMLQMKAGVEGQCDAYGYLAGGSYENSDGREIFYNAIPFEIEFKGARTPTSDKQRNWRQFCESWGIPYILLKAKKDETSVMTITRWELELHEFVRNLAG